MTLFLFTAAAYQPMLELLNYLGVNGFKTYIVSGGGIHLEYLKALSVTPDIFTVS